MSLSIHRNAISESLTQECLVEIENRKDQQVWSSSSCHWDEGIKQNIFGSCIISSVPEKLSEKLFSEVGKYFPPKYKKNKTSFQFYIWQYNSGISNHNDPGYYFGGTIYLNKMWDPNWGGIFLWNDYECDSTNYKNGWKAHVPEYRSLVINSSLRDHLVTPVAPNSPEFRYTIQIFSRP